MITSSDSSGRILTGDPTQIASYPYYGTAVLAVADGPIVANVTNLPDQKSAADPTGLTLPEYSGNHVVQDSGAGTTPSSSRGGAEFAFRVSHRR